MMYIRRRWFYLNGAALLLNALLVGLTAVRLVPALVPGAAIVLGLVALVWLSYAIQKEDRLHG